MATQVKTIGYSFPLVDGKEYIFSMDNVFAKVNTITSYTQGISFIGSATGSSFSWFARSSADGHFSGAWTPLTNGYLNALVGGAIPIYLEFKLILDAVGGYTDFTLNTMTVTYTTVVIDTTYGTNVLKGITLFDKLEQDDETITRLKANLYEKLEEYGIMPEFVKRTNDYESYWKAFSEFIAIIYRFNSSLNFIYTDAELLYKHLLQWGVYVCSTSNLASLQARADDLIGTILDRGRNTAPTEILSLICKATCDEFVFSMSNWDYAGNNIDKLSSDYKLITYLAHHDLLNTYKLNKLPSTLSTIAHDDFGLFNDGAYITDSTEIGNISESATLTVDVGGFSVYTLPITHQFQVGDVILGVGFTPSGYDVSQIITAVTDTTITTDLAFISTPSVYGSISINHNVINFDAPSGLSSFGIGRASSDNPFVIDTSISYEFTFFVKIANKLESFEIGMQTSDCDANQIIGDLVLASDNSTPSDYFLNGVLGTSNTSKFHFVRCIIYGKGTTIANVSSDGYENIVHLKFKDDATATKIYPFLQVGLGGGGLGDVDFYGLHFNPLGVPDRSGNYDGEINLNAANYVDMKASLIMIYKNNNNQYSDEDIEAIIKRDFINPKIIPLVKELTD